MTSAALIQFEKSVVRPFGDGKFTLRTEYSENCFIYQSFGLSESDFGDMMVTPHVTFLADSGDGAAAEWEPRYGPIQIWTKCDEDWQGEDCFKNVINAKPHWHFDFVEDRPGTWSQMAVEREGLRGLLARGDVGGVFGVLQRWALH